MMTYVKKIWASGNVLLSPIKSNILTIYGRFSNRSKTLTGWQQGTHPAVMAAVVQLAILKGREELVDLIKQLS